MTPASEEWWSAELTRLLPNPPQALQEALKWVCCPPCQVLTNLTFAFFRDLPARWPLDAGLREAVCVAGGFCHHHSWRLAEMQSQVAIATVYVDVTAALAESTTHDSAPCPVCRLAALASATLARLLVDRLQDPTERERFAHLFGLCYPHWRETLALDLPATLRDFLSQTQRDSSAALRKDLQAFLDKNTIQLKWTRTRQEQRAPRHAMLKTAGNEDL